MKKYFFIALFTIYSILFLFSLDGFDYFPLDNSKEWSWIAKENYTTYKIHWELIGIENILIDFEKVLAYRIRIDKTNDFFYFFSDMEYIYIYDPSNNSKKKILPRNVSLNGEWYNETYKYTITRLNNNELRVDYSNSANSTKGYQLFKRTVGLSYIFEKNNYTTYSLELIDFVKKPEERIVQQKPEEKIELNKYEYPFFTDLNPNRVYVQIGYMSIKDNAIQLFNKAKKHQLDAVIQVENDGRNYRVYIECDPKDQYDVLERARGVSSDAFIRRL